MVLKRRPNYSSQRKLPWVLTRDYTTDAGIINTAEFKNGSGDQLRLHKHLNANTNLITWTNLEPIVAVARRLGEIADKGDKAHLVVRERLRITHDPKKLGSIVAGLGGVQLMRLDHSGASIRWQREVKYKGGMEDDIAVRAGNWTEAEALAIHMGAGLEEGELFRLIENVSVARLIQESRRFYDTYPTEVINGQTQVAMSPVVPGTV